MVSPAPVILLYATLSGLLTSHLSRGYGGDVTGEELENVIQTKFKLYPWEYVNTLQGLQGETRGQSGEVMSSVSPPQTPQHYRLTDEDLTEKINKHNSDKYTHIYKRETNTEEDITTEATVNKENGGNNNNSNDKTEQNTEKYKLNMTYAETRDILKFFLQNYTGTIDIPDYGEEIYQPFTADPNVNSLDVTTPKYENTKLLNMMYHFVSSLIIPEQNNETLKVAKEFEQAQNKTDIVLNIIEIRVIAIIEGIFLGIKQSIRNAIGLTETQNSL